MNVIFVSIRLGQTSLRLGWADDEDKPHWHCTVNTKLAYRIGLFHQRTPILPQNDTGQADDAFYAMRRDWMDYVIENERLSHATVRVALFIARRSNARTGSCWWSVRRIAKMVHCSTRTVSDATVVLETEGLLFTTQQGRKNHYHIKFPLQIEHAYDAVSA